MRQIEIVQRFYDAFGEGDLDAATAVFADRVQMTDPGLGTVEGPAALRDRTYYDQVGLFTQLGLMEE